MTTEANDNEFQQMFSPPQEGPPESNVAPLTPQYAAAAPSNVLVTIGDIACTQNELMTPNGVYPLAGTNWIVVNNTRTNEKIPTYAIVLAICFAILCLVGLLFLLIKERTIEGSMQVSVQSPSVYYATQIPISAPEQVADIEQRVNYARGLVKALG
jgi:hypothetical protein